MIPGQDSLLEMELVLVKVEPLQVYYGKIGTMGGGNHCKVLPAFSSIIFLFLLIIFNVVQVKSEILLMI